MHLMVSLDSSLTEMCVGVTASCMPSLAHSVRHHFPNSSVVESLLRLKESLLLTTRRKTPSVAISASSSQDYIVRVATSAGEFGKRGKDPSASFDPQVLEMGDVAHITTRIDGSGTVEKDHPDGIRVQRAWQQTSQEMRRELNEGR